MDILKKINKMRLERNWSIYRLSIESGVSQSTLTNMFNRETLPSIITLECLCNAFGITMSDFFANPTEQVSLLSEEKEIIECYRLASPEARESIKVLLRELSDNKSNNADC